MAFDDALIECAKCDFKIIIKKSVKRTGQESYLMNENFINNEELKDHINKTGHDVQSVRLDF